MQAGQRHHCVGIVCLLGLVLASGGAAQTPAPTIVLSANSLEQFVTNLRYGLTSASQLGNTESAQMALAAGLFLGPKGEMIKGVDNTKPFGAYAKVTSGVVDSTFVVFLPIKNPEDFLGYLKRFSIQPEADLDQVYKVNVSTIPLPLFFRFKDGYLYGTAGGKLAISDAQLLNPKDLVPPNSPDLLLVVRPGQVPDMLKNILFDQLERTQAEGVPGTDGLSQSGIMAAIHYFAILLQDGEELRLAADLDPGRNILEVEMTFVPRPRSKLALRIQELGQVKSQVVGLMQTDSPVQLAMHGKLFEGFATRFWNLERELGPTEDSADPLADEIRQFREIVRKQLEPTDVDLAIDLRRDPKGLTWVFGTAVADSAALEAELRAWRQELPSNATLFVADAGQVGDTKIHQVVGSANASTEDPLYVAFARNTVLGARGVNPQAAIERMLKSNLESTSVPSFQLSVSLLETWRSVPGGSAKPTAKAEETARKISGPTPDDRLRVVVTGGDALSAKLRVHPKIGAFVLQQWTAQLATPALTQPDAPTP